MFLALYPYPQEILGCLYSVLLSRYNSKLAYLPCCLVLSAK
ncbi:Uncharacterised protein [Yersinia intermedia]|nr:Uncharacterised protein [Yersinia intermedia]CNH25375.1 Uncharacterised protein [Yersinia intermedia]